MEKIKHSNNFAKLAITLILTFIAGGVGSFATSPNIEGWYAGLQLPEIAPPNWVFGPVWMGIYITIAIAAWLVWRKGRNTPYVTLGLWVFVVQLVLNSLWSILFFGLQSPVLGLVGISVLWLVIVFMIGVFAKVSKTAALILLPYIIWVSFAGYLNYEIWILN